MAEIHHYRVLLLFIPLLATVLLFLWRRPSARVATAALFTFLWQLPALMLVHVIATHFGWWHFAVDAYQLLGLPVDVWLGWALWWGPVFLLATPKLNLVLLAAIAVWVDVLLMPLLEPVVFLGAGWLWGELLALVLVLVPAQLLGRWTSAEQCLAGRVLLLVLCFVGLAVWLLPTIILIQTGADWSQPGVVNGWLRSVMLTLLLLPTVMGLAAVYEFYLRGKGTPIPYDPPKHLVTTGPYAYLANPMQVSAALVWLLLGVWLQSIWVAAAALMAIVFGAGLADWEERTALKQRMGDSWLRYRERVNNWLPSWRPVGMPTARVYIATGCGPCEQLAFWLQCQKPLNLKIIPAQQHPSRDLIWITYCIDGESREEEGIVAIARVLEHIHLGWAWFGWMLRLPVISTLAQLLLELSFTKPLEVCVRVTDKNAAAQDSSKAKGQ